MDRMDGRDRWIGSDGWIGTMSPGGSDRMDRWLGILHCENDQTLETLPKHLVAIKSTLT